MKTSPLFPSSHNGCSKSIAFEVRTSADYTRTIALWNTILGVFDIKYMPQTLIKGQVLADLVAEFAEPPIEIVTEQRNMDEKSVGVFFVSRTLCWKMYIDGAAN